MWIKYILIVCMFIFFSVSVDAEEEFINKKEKILLNEISSLLTFGNKTTIATVNQCVFKITTRVRETCNYPTEPNWVSTTISLKEVKEMEFRPFKNGVVLSIELNVPSPPIAKTIWNRLTKDPKSAFEEFVVESDQLLSEKKLVSRRTVTSCAGIETERISRSHDLFFNAKPQSWSEMQRIVSECR